MITANSPFLWRHRYLLLTWLDGTVHLTKRFRGRLQPWGSIPPERVVTLSVAVVELPSTGDSSILAMTERGGLCSRCMATPILRRLSGTFASIWNVNDETIFFGEFRCLIRRSQST